MKIDMFTFSRRPVFAGWSVITEFENIIADYFDVTLVCRQDSGSGRWNELRFRLRHNYRFEDFTPESPVAIVIALSPSSLNDFFRVRNIRKKYDKIIALVIDSYFYPAFTDCVKDVDFLFVSSKDDADEIAARYNVKAELLPIGFDCLRWAAWHDERPIDVVAFGRQPQSYIAALKAEFHRPESPYALLHSPIGATYGPEVLHGRSMLLKMLQRTQISLAFHLFVEPEAERPRAMIVTNRWFESLACGAIVMGKRPVSRMADELLDWPDSTIELPDDAVDAVDAIADALKYPGRLSAMRRRNVAMMLARHDWRHRIADLATMCGLSLPQQLSDDLECLAVRSESVTELAMRDT